MTVALGSQVFIPLPAGFGQEFEDVAVSLPAPAG